MVNIIRNIIFLVKIFSREISFITGFITLFILSDLPDPLFNYKPSTLVLDKNQKVLRAYLNEIQHYQFIDPSLNLPDKLEKAIIEYEDDLFYYHPGINPFSILRALKQNILEAEIISGASTVTMQVMRLSRPKARNYWNKFIESLQALRLEFNYSKNEILKIYANHAPYGGNIIGYYAASLKYFGKKPKQLSWAESALLAVLPNAPGLLRPGKNNHKLKLKRDKLLKRLNKKGVISDEIYSLSIMEKIELFIQSFPKRANHFSDYINKNNPSQTFKSSIDFELQEKFERLAHNYQQELIRLGIKNLAFLITETKTGKVRSYVGSQNYWDIINNGMVDGVRSNRSSGSVLKPFLYILAIENGELLPGSYLEDIPVFFNGFSPKNASEKYYGLVSLETALIHSLNVPAVITLQKYGVYPFYQKLKNMGLSTLFRSADEYGLSLILGGAEVNLWEMSSLYLKLANNNENGRLIYLESDSSIVSSYRLDPIASYKILGMMKKLKRPGSEYYWDRFDSSWPIAWKTGTSYGQKDAWAIGLSPDWTIAVWVGNFTGEGSPNLGGARSAGPLLFRIFNLLEKQKKWFDKPTEKSSLYKVCKTSGYLINRDCPDYEFMELKESPVSYPQCQWHKRFIMTNNERELLCSSCWDDDRKETVKYVLKSNVSFYLSRLGKNSYNLPKHRKSCKTFNKEKLSFVYPEHKSQIAIPRDFNKNKMQIVTRVNHNSSSRLFYWYLDDRLIGESKKPEFSFNCQAGEHKLTVIDENGNQADRLFTVLESL